MTTVTRHREKTVVSSIKRLAEERETRLWQ